MSEISNIQAHGGDVTVEEVGVATALDESISLVSMVSACARAGCVVGQALGSTLHLMQEEMKT